MPESEQESAPRGIDTSKPSVARVYDYILGGKDNYASDRHVAAAMLEIAPDAPQAAASNRHFLRRTVRHLAGEVGIRQFLDIGSGLPTQGNVHEVAQSVAPGAHVVYVDNDPIVLAHGRALLAVDETTTIIEADAREPERILDDPRTRDLIDFTQPVGLLLFGILHHMSDAEDPAGVAARLIRPLAPGSHVVISHFQNPGQAHPEVAEQAVSAERVFNEHLGTGRWRTREEILAFFDGLELLEPGLVPLPEWRPEPDEELPELGITYHTFAGGVGRKP
ncbi:S-adenosyl methyltransferase [Nonomuraea fuscirosea]|uniref:S-adenosyl methyltransferase n=1 Tax=Nonomuraea fuscirosea TaxID=1291556 RepID=A0A2T0M5M1_9ACTN|nr:SAM-dependent methyltransferase [Nonomuraea fuscirosea]PRX52746.1 S-adenosyl methyltransferase [Nonomuraea fuscirosea]